MSDDPSSSRPIAAKLIACENILCGMGNGWGKINKAEHLFLWWGLRHLVYGGLSVLLVYFIPESLLPLVYFFVVVHVYKLMRYTVVIINDGKKNKGKEATAQSEKKDFNENEWEEDMNGSQKKKIFEADV